ncbi:MAG TPA: PKD domain-containing protein, partial [Niastella sp.]|nr:PKD domain-containing protein [Niastella sp.]
ASAMINAGKASPATKDFVSTPVPFNGGYDIGAYESILLAPVANAGADQVITLPADLNLTGSGSDEDGTIEGYSWTRTAGPALYQINTPSNASTTVSNLAEGTYTFRLTVKDNDGKTQYDDVKVVVNPAPPPPGTKFIKVNVYAGTNPYLNTGWNNWNVGSSAASNKMFTGLKYSDGSGSTVNAVLSQTSSISDNGSTYGSGIAPAEVLRYGSTYTGTRTLTLQGLSTSKSYNLEFYASRKTTTTTTNNYSIFTINGDVVNLNVVNNLTTKASFLNVVPNASGQILITINQTETYNYLNGFTLVETESSLLKNKFVKTSIFGGTNPFNNSEWNNWNVGT